MKKPDKNPKEIYVKDKIIDSWGEYTPDQLRDIAAKMEELGYLSVELHIESWSGDGILSPNYRRLETEEEVTKRHEKEMEAYENYLHQQKVEKEREDERFFRKAKELGYRLEKL